MILLLDFYRKGSRCFECILQFFLCLHLQNTVVYLILLLTNLLLQLVQLRMENVGSNTKQKQQQNNALYLMVDPCQIPDTLGDQIRIFNLHDGIKHIVGYCLPLKKCAGVFKAIPPARVIKVVESPLINEIFMNKYKFPSFPLNVAPMNEKEFHEMIRSRPQPYRSSQEHVQKNRFFVRSNFPSQAQKRPQADDSAMNFFMIQYKLERNPHLIPYRLPDGLNCFLMLLHSGPHDHHR